MNTTPQTTPKPVTQASPKAETVNNLKRELRQLRAEMRQRGIRKVSCFNGGLSADESRYNTELFRLNTELAKLNA